MPDIIIVYLFFAVIGLGFILLTLPTMIARSIVEREKKEGLYRIKKRT